jgi:CheY-like chemotaxis protein
MDAMANRKIEVTGLGLPITKKMPEMSGIEATKIIREEIGTEYAKTVPIIALTANAIIGNDEMFLKHGFQDFVSKPIDVQRLDAVIKRWVRNIDLEKALAEQALSGGKNFLEKRSGKDRRSGADRRSGYDRRIFAEKITGVNIHKGLSRFSGDMKVYVGILRSFTSNTRLLVETLRDVSEAGLENYTINVHGMKSSCRGIGAEAAGSMAEALEQAGKRGDLDFITANNPALLETVVKLITDIENALATATGNNAKDDKPKKDRPDAETLSKLLAACKNYKAEDIDALMEEIERFEYESDEGLAKWLRENVDQMNYSEIAERLEQN